MRPYKYMYLVSIFLGYAHCLGDTVASTAKEVTLYPQGAQVTRTARADLKKGKNEIVISGLSPFINTNSIQVNGSGNYTIISVSHKYNFIDEDQKKSQQEGLRERKDSVEHELDLQTAYLTVAVEEENMLLKNQSIGGANSGVKTLDLKEGIEYQRQKMTETELEQVKINKKIKDLNELKEKLEKQSKDINAVSIKTTSEIAVTINSEEVTKADLKISYFVTEAKWSPYYDIRVKDINSPMEFLYKANISQSSGEEWKDVSLTLSTSEPQLGAQKPYLQKWTLFFNNYARTEFINNNLNTAALPQYSTVMGKVMDGPTGEPLIGVNVTAKGTTVGTVTDVDGNYALSIPNGSKILVFSYVGYDDVEKPITSSTINIYMESNSSELEEVVVSSMNVKRNLSGKAAGINYNGFVNDQDYRYGFSSGLKKRMRMYEGDTSNMIETETSSTPIDVSFTIKTPYSIISDGKINSVDIQAYDVPASYKYYAVPKLDKSAFLTAFLTDWAKLNLLPGEANLYVENTFVGRSIINPDITEDTLEISLGRDKNIVVKRELVKDFSKKQFVGGNRIIDKSWQISVKNNKNQPIDIIIQDQFPISTLKEIVVDQVDRGNAELEDETGFLKWKLFVEPSAEKKVVFKYSVKYPKDQFLRVE